jgi:purine-binding chemotaxis protein CheW
MAQPETTINQYLTFILDDGHYGLSIDSVQEVLELMSITKVPRTPDHMLGVTNVRGQAVPVIDLRQRFGLKIQEQTVDTCIVIVEMAMDGESMTLGALVDGVEEVMDLDPGQIEPAPKLGGSIDTRFIRGIAKQEDRFIILLDINECFDFQDLADMRNVA